MRTFRTFLRDHRWLAMLLIALALCVKALVPAGFMIGQQANAFAIEICNGQGTHLVSQIVIPQSQKHGDGRSDTGKSDSQCPYSALSLASLGGADPILLTLALLFSLTLGFKPTPLPERSQILYLRPPVRGPPLRVK